MEKIAPMAEQADTPITERTHLAIARNIVNQLFDVAEVPASKRILINDRCDTFVADLLMRWRPPADDGYLKESCAQCKGYGKIEPRENDVMLGEITYPPIDCPSCGGHGFIRRFVGAKT